MVTDRREPRVMWHVITRLGKAYGCRACTWRGTLAEGAQHVAHLQWTTLPRPVEPT